ncbi:MAG: 16S rRNA (cytosine(1402)-N(4))-methyltransferase RsmH [bacterium]|nr:16S rRNA (cytosine(1402)-N(4))-methyltransferase RsmH [bacterium]
MRDGGLVNSPAHIPVLRDASVQLLAAGPGRRIIDGTFGQGGHARALLATGAEVLGLDLDPDAGVVGRALAAAEARFHFQHRSFRDLAGALAAAGWAQADGLLLDLGVSSLQIDEPSKGFTYRADAPLDLRFDPGAGPSAADLLARLDEAALATLLWTYGEERRSRRIAAAMVAARREGPLATTGAVREVVASAVGRGPVLTPTLSRVFQALRIAVNDELGALQDALEQAPARLAAGGRLVVISYHSLEDRAVKQWFARESRDCLCPPRSPVCICGHRRTLSLLTRRPQVPAADEVGTNPRARSAKLRAAERL